MTFENLKTFPCELGCREKRSTIVNLVLEKGTCSVRELHAFLDNKIGSYAFRSSVEYLCKGQCKLVGVYGLCAGQKPPQIGRRGRLLYRRTIAPETLQDVVVGLLSPLQKRILDKFTLLNRRIFYFTAYDLRRLIPSSGNEVEYSVKRLITLGLLDKLTSNEIVFYVKPSNVPRLLLQERQAILDDKTEYAIIKIVHELIMNLYPANTITGYGDRIRPHTQDILTVTGGMAFDIFYQFRDPIAERNYLAIDVYTRIPVTGFMVHSFTKKIEWAKTVTRKKTTNYLRDKTFGIIVYRNATRNAIMIANRIGLKFLRLRDIKVDYKQLRNEIENQISANP
jgi:hypothetical protein